jgi:ribA/ribD-fused uncharacterized protein
LGRNIKNFEQTAWDKVKFDIVVTGNFHKFSQNESFKNFLLATQHQILVEASPYDTVWGIGLKETEAAALNPNTWQGENLLGFALMTVRDKLLGIY